jgi:hypothetical protein
LQKAVNPSTGKEQQYIADGVTSVWLPEGPQCHIKLNGDKAYLDNGENTEWVSSFLPATSPVTRIVQSLHHLTMTCHACSCDWRLAAGACHQPFLFASIEHCFEWCLAANTCPSEVTCMVKLICDLKSMPQALFVHV